jgi:hypothetical protein
MMVNRRRLSRLCSRLLHYSPFAQPAERQKSIFPIECANSRTKEVCNSLVNTHQVGFMNAQLLFTVCSSGSSSLFRYNLTTKPPDLPGRCKAKTSESRIFKKVRENVSLTHGPSMINQNGERNKSFFDRPRCCERHAAEMRIDKKGKSPVCSNSQTEVGVKG